MVNFLCKKLTFFSLITIMVTLFNALSQSADNNVTQYPIKQPPKQQWSFAGPFGVYDNNQLQRGLKIYQEVCSTCHSLKYVSFNSLKGIGLSDTDIKVIAAHYQVASAPNEEGEVKMRAAGANDYFPNPFANDKLAAFVNNGIVPVDLSLIARARTISAPFPNFIHNIFTNYTSAGPDYIYALLTGYENPPPNYHLNAGNYYNPYFNAGNAIAMPPSLYDDSVAYDDGTAQTLDQYARDIAAFLMWSADPHMVERKKTGFRVIVFLIMFASLAYYSKKRIWAEKQSSS